MSVWIPMKHVSVADSYHLVGEYAYRNAKGWVKWGHTDEMQRRASEHKTSLGELPPIICMIERATKWDDTDLKNMLAQWRVPMTVEWFYNEEAMWREVERFAGMRGLGFIRLDFEPKLPLFDDNGPTDGVHPYVS